MIERKGKDLFQRAVTLDGRSKVGVLSHLINNPQCIGRTSCIGERQEAALEEDEVETSCWAGNVQAERTLGISLLQRRDKMIESRCSLVKAVT